LPSAIANQVDDRQLWQEITEIEDRQKIADATGVEKRGIEKVMLMFNHWQPTPLPFNIAYKCNISCNLLHSLLHQAL